MFRQYLTTFLALIISSSVFAEELVVYSGRKAKFVKPLIEEFSKQSGVDIKLLSGSSSILLSTLALQGDKAKADIYLGNDVANLQRGSDNGIFRKLPAHITSVVPSRYRSANADWVGLSARLRVLVVNTNKPYTSNINSVLDLAAPDMKNRIAITHSNNESFISGASSYRHILGKADYMNWLKGIKNNADSNIFHKHSHIVSAVATGKVDVGLVNHYYALSHMKKHPDAPLKLVIPDQKQGQIGAAWNMSGIAISRYSKNHQAAERLVAFLLSAQNQKIFAEVNQEYPTRPRVPLAKGVPTMKTIRLIKTPLEEISHQREDTITELHRVGL
ncbi:MAG: extracellular solute-binding protein [Gammaproteobacteria bacterium]|nr:extracellular solute-binding protein [Gammaproteobacteria bacterium]